MAEDWDSLESCGEAALIQQLLANIAASDNLRVPAGDDCAAVVLPSGESELLLTSDPVIEGVHFQPRTAPTLIGHKAAGRVLSDMAAMGAAPHWLLINIAAPPHTKPETLISITKSAQALASEFDAGIVGGDVASSAVLSVNAFACGTAPRGSAVTRAGARPGHALYVTGSLGGSSDGTHLTFLPRVREGIWLREHSYADSMIDLSDGLATDLRHILNASGAGASLDLPAIPLSEALHAVNRGEAISRALCEGEDFELLFSIDSSQAGALETEWKKAFDLALTRIGTVTDETDALTGKTADGEIINLTEEGFQHFGTENA